MMPSARGNAGPSQSVTVLLTSVGRQSYLVEAFQHAGSRVVASDCDSFAAGIAAADHGLVSPAFGDPEYGNWLLQLCRAQSVDGIISLHTDELVVLQTFHEALHTSGVCLLGMTGENLMRCVDKRRLHEVAAGTDFAVPRSWDIARLDEIPADAFPLLIKPAFGRGSRGNVFVSCHAEVTEQLRDAFVGPWLAQEFVDGVEYGLDLVNDLEGIPRAVLQRKKARMWNGETDVAETTSEPDLRAAAMLLAAKLRHSGLVDVDIMRSANGLFLLDINPRFGGGYIFNHAAGANVPAALVAWLAGKQPDPSVFSFATGVAYARVSTLQRIR